MAAPIRSSSEIATILNKAKHTMADLGYETVNQAKIGKDFEDADFTADAYRLIILDAYLGVVLDPITGNQKLYYTAAANEKKFNLLLDAIAQLSNAYNGPAIPILYRSPTLVYYPSASGPSQGGSSQSGGPANPGGVTFQNINVSSPGEIVDTMNATDNEYAFYIIRIRGTNSGEGSRLDIVGVNWFNGASPVLTIYRGDASPSGTVPNTVTYSAAIVANQMELTAVVPTDGWVVKGTRISFENISFQNAQGPLPTGGTVGEYLRKSSSVDYDAAFAAIQQSEISGLATALTNRLLKSGGTMTGILDLGGFKIINLATGTDGTDAIRRSQLNSEISDREDADTILQNNINTLDADKADLSALTSHTSNTSNPHSVTKSQVGLGNANNTSDVNKPVSTAQQTAIDAAVADFDLSIDKTLSPLVDFFVISGSYGDVTTRNFSGSSWLNNLSHDVLVRIEARTFAYNTGANGGARLTLNCQINAAGTLSTNQFLFYPDGITYITEFRTSLVRYVNVGETLSWSAVLQAIHNPSNFLYSGCGFLVYIL